MTLLPIILASMLPIVDIQADAVIGSSVLINHQIVLTASHVATTRVFARCGNTDIEANPIAYDTELDLSLLALVKPCTLPVSTLAEANVLAGSAVHGIGCPKRHCGWLVFGHVLAYDYTPSPMGNARRALISDVPIWMGNSGGPLFDEKNQVTGIASQLIRFDGPDGMFRLFAAYVPAETIWIFLRQVSAETMP